MGLANLKNELKTFEKPQLINLIADLYKANKSVREYLDFFVNPDEKALFEKYRQKVVEAFYPKRGLTLKLKDGKQAIRDFRKNGPSAELIADLMLVYVETGVRFTNEFGDIDEPFYDSLERTFASALALLKNENLLSKFRVRVESIVLQSRGLGWGFSDAIAEIHGEYYR